MDDEAGMIVVRISRKFILEHICPQLEVSPPEFACSSTASGQRVASVTLQYRKPEAPEELCVETLTGETQDSDEEAIEWVAERAIDHLKSELHAEVVDFSYKRLQVLRERKRLAEKEMERRRAILKQVEMEVELAERERTKFLRGLKAVVAEFSDDARTNRNIKLVLDGLKEMISKAEDESH